MKHFPTFLELYKYHADNHFMEWSKTRDHTMSTQFVSDMGGRKNLYSQILTPDMFIPMAKDENEDLQILSPPLPSNYESLDAYKSALIWFESAQSRVLFSGWNVLDEMQNGRIDIADSNGSCVISFRKDFIQMPNNIRLPIDVSLSEAISVSRSINGLDLVATHFASNKYNLPE